MGQAKIDIKVQCYAGYRGEETPRAVLFKNKKIEVVSVLDRWLAPDHRYFKVCGDDGGVYLIRHDVEENSWELTMYDAGRLDPTGCRPIKPDA